MVLLIFLAAKVQIIFETSRVARVKSGEMTRKKQKNVNKSIIFPKSLDNWNKYITFAA